MLKDNIKKYRKIANINQKELAEITGVSYSTITKLESGELQNPSEEVLSKMATALNCEAASLRYGTMTKEELYEVIDELKYNIKDGISIPGCRFRFSTDTYEGAIGALTLLKQRIEKWEAQNDK